MIVVAVNVNAFCSDDQGSNPAETSLSNGVFKEQK